MRISDWSSDVCSSDLAEVQELRKPEAELRQGFELRFSEHARCRRDGRGIYNIVVYCAKAPAGSDRDRESSTRRRGVHRVSPQAGPGSATGRALSSMRKVKKWRPAPCAHCRACRRCPSPSADLSLATFAHRTKAPPPPRRYPQGAPP